jgi:RNA polymerase sigma-70 factor (ECF subfamily)
LDVGDDVLVQSARRGDVDSFAQLYRRHFAMAVGIAYCVLSDRGLAEDAAQDSFAEACRHLGKLRDGRKFPSWLAAICRRAAARMKRSRRPHRELAEQELEAPASDDDSRREAIWDAVQRLPPAAREVIVLHYFSRQSHEEIALTLSITPAAVHGRLIRAREHIRRQLMHEGLGVDMR